jgi:ribosomal-protein-alanine N-acetyltransferase
MDATLRVSRPEDFEQLYEIDQACYPSGIAYSRRTLRRFLGLRHADCVVAEVGGKVVAFIVSLSEDALAHIITIDVLEPYRRSGIGSALLREAERHLESRDIREVSLETATSNAAAVAFWEKHRYRTRRLLKNYYPGRVDAWYMTKALGSEKET